ncbi:MAG: hypothetical protein LBR80_08185 [Deltaproteobacteria bacterium]|jgi:predicted nucleic acid-binding protein|nr:hypothetical protein [Deltaproteobacteria bacterium]
MASPIIIVSELDDEVFFIAGRLKAEYARVSLADSILVAHAMLSRGTVVTSDHHELDRVQEGGIDQDFKIFFFRGKPAARNPGK